MSDRLAAVQQFDDSRAGVKGLVDAGITTVPFFFHHPRPLLPPSAPAAPLSIPTVDLSLPRPAAVDLVRAAASSLGFFHVVNHPLPLPLLSRAISAFRSFNDLPPAVRSAHYSRQPAGGVSYASNFDLFRSPAASWRDTLQITWAPGPPDASRIPEACRRELVELEEEVKRVGKLVMELLAEGLGAESGRLEGMTCLEGRQMVCHYYPWCPEPERTRGLAEHTDPGVVTLLAQDGVGGLQVKWEGEDGQHGWVDVEPVEGALLVNVGDLLQMISNDEYKSVEHRVVANSCKEGRVSIAVFFNPGKRGETDLYGPLPELVSPEKPALYRNFTMSEFMGTFFNRGLGSRCLVDYFRL